jgi:tRNA pseudouridine55 synthase
VTRSSDVSRGGTSGVLVVDKPRGVTSHDVVVSVRRALREREVGHAGTLDPMATGVLVLGLGEGTKLVPWLTAQAKEYEATLALGVETDTLDAEGAEVRRVATDVALVERLADLASATGEPRVQAALAAERGRTSQVPPVYSAIRTQGERAFVRARRGESLDLPARPVHVLRLDLVGCAADPPRIDLVVEVSKGYYVRSLARDLAASLGTVGHLTRLRRTRSGAFGESEATPVTASSDVLRSAIVPLAAAATRALPTSRLTESGACDARHGRPVESRDLDCSGPGPSAWLDPNGALVAVGEIDLSGRGSVVRGFRA